MDPTPACKQRTSSMDNGFPQQKQNKKKSMDDGKKASCLSANLW